MAALIAVLVVLNVPVYWIGIKVLFGGTDEFWRAVGFWLTPDVFSLFSGQYLEDVVAELKLGVFVVGCGGIVFCEYQMFAAIFGIPGS